MSEHALFYLVFAGGDFTPPIVPGVATQTLWTAELFEGRDVRDETGQPLPQRAVSFEAEPCRDRDRILSVARAAHNFAVATGGLLYDCVLGRFFTDADFSGFRIQDHVTIWRDPETSDDVTRLFTEGMAKFGRPDFEWHWSPAESSSEAARMLNAVMEYSLRLERDLEAGEILQIAGTGITFLLSVTDDGFLRLGMVEDRADLYDLNNAAWLLIREGKAADAIPLLRRALQIDPGYVLARNNLGNAYLQMGNVEDAQEEYERAVQADPAYAMPHRNLALVHSLAGESSNAISEYQNYLLLAPPGSEDADAHFNLAVLLQQQRHDADARTEYERAIAIRPEFAQALNNLGMMEFAARRIDRAIDLYRRALQADPHFHPAAYNLGIAYSAAGDHPRAISEFQHIVEGDPANREAASNLAVVYTNIGRHDDAIHILEQLVHLGPNEPVFHFNLAAAYAAKGLTAEAVRAFETVIALEPEDSRRARTAQDRLHRLRVA